MQEELRRELEQLVRGSEHPALGVHVIELPSRRELFSLNAAEPRMMASTAKLFTLGAVLAGPGFSERCLDAGRRSDNAAAEELGVQLAQHSRGWGPMLIRRRQGGAAEVIRRHVAQRLPEWSRRLLRREYQQVDASGMKFANAASPRVVTDFLAAAAAAPYAESFRDSLALMGVRGTLSRRGRGTAAEGTVFAKTGTHLTPRRWPEQPKEERRTRASALSGYCLARGGMPAAAFSVMMENPASGQEAQDLQDRIANVLARHVQNVPSAHGRQRQ